MTERHHHRGSGVGHRRSDSALVGVGAAALVGGSALFEGSAGIVTRHQFGLICWACVAIGLLVGVLPRARPTPAGWLLIAALGALTLITALSMAWSASIERSLEEVARVSGYLGLAVLLTLTIRRQEWRLVATGVLVAAVSICGLAVISRLLSGDFGTEIVGSHRLAYPLGYWNALASWSAATFAMLLAWSAEMRRIEHRALALAATPVAGLCLYLTYSRGGIVAAAVGIVAVLVLSEHRKRVAAHALIGLVLTLGVVVVVRTQPGIADGTGTGGAGWVALALVGAVAAGWYAPRLTWSSGQHQAGAPIPHGVALKVAAATCAVAMLVPLGFAALGDPDPVLRSPGADPASRVLTADGNRPAYWDTSLQAFAHAPVGGLGAGTFEFYWAREGGSSEQVRDAHSLYLENLAELGLPGLLAVLLLAWAMLWLSLVARRGSEFRAAAVGLPAAVIVFVVHAGVDALWEWTAVTALALSAACASGAAAATRRPSARSQAGAGTQKRRWNPVLATVLVGLGLAVQVPGLVAGVRLRDSNTATRFGLVERALQLSSDAVEAEPWAATPYASRALVRVAAGDPEAAISDILEAIDREPVNFRHWVALAQLEREVGDRKAAKKAFAMARSLGPDTRQVRALERDLGRTSG